MAKHPTQMATWQHAVIQESAGAMLAAVSSGAASAYDAMSACARQRQMAASVGAAAPYAAAIRAAEHL